MFPSLQIHSPYTTLSQIHYTTRSLSSQLQLHNPLRLFSQCTHLIAISLACSCLLAGPSSLVFLARGPQLGQQKQKEPEDLSARVYFNVTFWHLLAREQQLLFFWLLGSLSSRSQCIAHCLCLYGQHHWCLWQAGRQAEAAGRGIPCWFAVVRGTLTAWNVDSSRLAASSFMTPLALYVNQRMQPHHRLWAIAVAIFGDVLLLLPHLDVAVTIFSAYRFPILFLTC